MDNERNEKLRRAKFTAIRAFICSAIVLAQFSDAPQLSAIAQEGATAADVFQSRDPWPTPTGHETPLEKSRNHAAYECALQLKAKTYESMKKYAAAAQVGEQCVHDSEGFYGPFSVELACSWIKLASTYLSMDDALNFNRCWRNAIAASSRLTKQSYDLPTSFDDPLTKQLGRLSEEALNKGLIPQSDWIMRAAIGMAAQFEPRAAEQFSMQELLNYYQQNDRYSDAENLLTFAVEKYKAKFGGDDVRCYAPTLCTLAEVYTHDAASNPPPDRASELQMKAIEALRKAIACFARGYGSGTQEYTLMVADHVNILPPEEAAAVRNTFGPRKSIGLRP